MSRARKRDNYSPSLFPFLAVLLCTMGALVLLLMLIVSQAQASAKQVAVDKRERIEEAESQLDLVRNAFEKQLEQRRLDLERKRLALQHLEKHIQELLIELESIGQTAALLDDKLATDATAEAEKQRKISELEAQLAKATKDLKQKLDKPDGDKPIFAIIPYQGTNGTHRRPIYLECVENGVLIQPEGILIGLADLRPPYGPGNPLDAALRTVRTRFSPANGALTSTAYPLLIVRPSGIRSYAMARQAMSGWDDQFGYELIDEELQLAFPESQAGLSAEIEKSLALARERQAALVMAMPQKYRQFINAAGRGDQFDFSDDEGGFGDDWVNGSAGAARQSASGPGAAGRSTLNRTRGGFSTSGNEVVGSGVDESLNANISGGSVGIASKGTQPTNTATDSVKDGSDWNASDSSAGPTNSNGYSFFGNGSSRQSATGIGESSSGQTFAGGTAGSNAGNTGGSGSETGAPGDRNDASGSQAASGTYTSQSKGSTNGLRATSNAAGGQASNATQGASGATSGPGGNASSPSGAASSGASEQQTANSTSVPPDTSTDPQMQNMSPSLDMDMTRNRQSKSTPVAQTLGRNWAWTEGPPSKTAVIRSIRVVCYSDRWVVMPEAGSSSGQVTIYISNSPQASAEKLAKTVTDRVSKWGIALSGGYWKPELAVDVAPDAEQRFQQLVRLLEGSGLAIQRRSASN